MKQDLILIRSIVTFTLNQGKGHTIQLFTSSVMISLLGLTLPLVILQVFDRVIPNSALETLTWLISGGILAVIFESILKYTRVNTTSEISDKFEYETGKELFHNILNNSNLQKKSPGKLIDAFNSVSHLRNFYSGELYQSLLDLPFAFLFIVIILNISISIGVYLIAVIAVYFAISKYVIGPAILRMQESQNKAEQKSISFLLETFSNILKIKTNHFEEKQLRKSETVQTHISESSYYSGNLDAFKGLVSSLGGQMIFFGVIAIGAYLATTGNLTVGQLTACSFIARRVFAPVQSFAQLLISLEKFQASQGKIKEILNSGTNPNEVNEKFNNDSEIYATHIEGTVHIQSLSLIETDQPLINNLTSLFKAKTMTYISCDEPGKSTILAKLISGFIKPSKGIVSLDGISYEKFSSTNLNNLVSYVPQGGTFIEGTVIENITLFNPSKNSLAQDCIGMLGQMNFISDLPNGFETKIDSRNVEFYPGLKEVLTVARELIKRPRVIIFDRVDEPMDQSDFNSFIWLLKKVKSKTTIIVISKNKYFKQISDQNFEFKSSKLSREEN